MLRNDDLIITIAYFSIPVQMIVSLWRYPRLNTMPWRVRGIMVLFALFIFLCGAGHLLRCTRMTDTVLFEYVNAFTALISLVTALYLLPFVPDLMSRLDDNIQELTKLNKDLRESKQHLMTFMAFLCHEIRNPLFAITSSITFLGDDPLEDQAAAVELKNIGQSADLMLRLVNDVLDIAKLEAGKMELEEHVFDLSVLLQGVSSSMHSHIKSPNVQFSAQISSKVPQKARGDSVRILQVLYNLLTNACKFTEHGTVSLQTNLVGCESPEAAPDNPCPFSHVETITLVELIQPPEGTFVLEFVVSDTGCGIPPHRIHHIFEPYAQSKLSDYRQHGGTGLGLSIISKLVRLMKGELAIQSSETVGSRFTVRLPLHPAMESTELTNSNHAMDEELVGLILSNASASRTSTVGERLRHSVDTNITSMVLIDDENDPNVLVPSVNSNHVTIDIPSEDTTNECRGAPPLRAEASKRITPMEKYADFDESTLGVLVVDDNSMNLKILCRMLKTFGLQHVTAENGLEAVEEMKNNGGSFGLILMDLSMPVMDGLEATRQIRDIGYRHLPIIALTANAVEEGADEALQAGATEFATKPILRDDLYEKCKQYLINGELA